MRLFTLLWRLCLPLALLACADPANPASPNANDADDAEALCARAAEHLAACALDLPAPATTTCDADLAATVLATDCAALSGQFADAKADGPLGRLACALGFYAACPVPACPDAPETDVCTDYLDVYDDCRLCNYYDCREQTAQCGRDAYLIDYVGRYCRRFAQVTEPRVGPEANAWLKRVRRCLADYLEAEVPYDADCETIDRLGTDSHALCYLETGFCDLAVTDWMAIVHTIDVGDAPFRVMLATAQGCLGEWLGPIDR
jgi:hypothetical protein